MALDDVLNRDDVPDDVRTLIEKEIDERRHMTERLKRQTMDFGERAKELSRLYGLTVLAEMQDVPLETILCSAIDLIPQVLQYPDKTCARFTIGDEDFRTENFADTPWRERRDVFAHGEFIGALEVGYLDGRLKREEELVLEPERHLISAIAERLGHIIEHRRLEEALIESRERYRTLFETMWNGFALHEIICDKNGKPYDFRFLEVNPAFEQMTGLSRNEVVGRTASDVLPGLGRWTETYGKVALTGKPVRFEHYSATLDRYYEIYAFSPRRGQFACLFADRTGRKRVEEELSRYRDHLEEAVQERTAEMMSANARLQQKIAEHERAEEALRSSEALYRSTVDSMEDAIYVVDTDLRIVLASKVLMEWCQDLGLQIGDPIGRDVSDLFSFLPQRIRDEYASVIETGKVLFAEERYNLGGRDVLTGTWKIPVFEGGRVTRVITIVRDMTAQRRAEIERRQLEAQIQQAQRLESLAVLAGGIAHDFDNILQGVLGNASIALMQIPPGSPARASIEHIETAAVRASQLAHQMLAYSGKGTFVIQPLNLSELVSEMSDLLAASISKKAALRRNLKADIPLIAGDATQLRQVIMNLITNASEALGENEGLITVSTDVVQVGRDYLSQTFLNDELPEGVYVSLQVSDTGCGMDDDMKVRIFDPFFTTKPSGGGLGLAAVLGIVRGHRGALEVDSRSGRGTTFRVLFPTTEAELAVVDRDDLRPIEHDEGWRGHGTILIVDDEYMVRQVTRTLLEMFGFTVLLAEDGVRGVELFRKHSDEIVAVLLDMKMPRMNGEEAFREIRNTRSDVPVIIVSAISEKSVPAHLADQGVGGFLQKPYKAAELLNMIRTVLDRSGRTGS